MYRLLFSILLCIFSLGTLSAEPSVWGNGKVSPYVRKVLIALEHKGISYQNQDILPAVILRALNQEIPKEFTEASPLGKIPAFQDGDFSIADSSVILAYLERAHPQHSLYPKNPQLFARALWLEKYGDTVLSEVTHTLIVENIINPKIFNKPTDGTAVQAALNEKLPPLLEYLESQLNTSWAGQYFIGNELTVADIAIGTHLVSLKRLEVAIDAKQFPKLSAYFEGLLKEPSIKKVLDNN